MWAKVREEVAAGRQAYVVCPLIGESEKLEVASAEETFERLEADELSGLRLGLLHGRLPAAEKEATMARVPGRASSTCSSPPPSSRSASTSPTPPSWSCSTPTASASPSSTSSAAASGGAPTRRSASSSPGAAARRATTRSAPQGNARLEAMVRTDDGFELAEVDLDIRGEGTILGERQKGRNDLKLASLRRDREVGAARAGRRRARSSTTTPRLADHPDLEDELRLFLDAEDEAFLFKS